MKVLAILASVVAVGAQSNDATFNQTQGDDGLYHMDVGVSYGFPGLPPRTDNSGVGTVRVTLTDASFKVESVDAGYSCTTESPSAIVCSSEGVPKEGGGTAFPNSMTVRLVSQTCWEQTGTADVWAAPTDPGGAPDVSLPVRGGGCQGDAGGQPAQDTKETCKVPNVKGLTVGKATRELTANDCLKGRVTFAFSSKVKNGRVIKQSQRPGKTLTFRSKVNLVVSKGKKK